MLQYKDLQTEGVSFLYGYSIAKLQSGIQYQVYSIIDSWLLYALQIKKATHVQCSLINTIESCKLDFS